MMKCEMEYCIIYKADGTVIRIMRKNANIIQKNPTNAMKYLYYKNIIKVIKEKPEKNLRLFILKGEKNDG